MHTDDERRVITPRLIWRVYHIPIIFGILSLLFVALSITIFIKSYQYSSPITFSSDESEASSTGIKNDREVFLVVDIEGAVRSPGVYRVPLGSRIDDLLTLAGGLASDADMESVARSVNRAAPLTDGAKIYIPDNRTLGSETSIGVPDVSLTTLNINTASESELEALSGIGTITAAKIISGRPYQRVEELSEKKIINQSVYETLRNQLTL